MFSNSHAIGLIGIFQFIFPNSHIWVDTNTKPHIYLGMHPQPDVTITISEANLLNILDGSANLEQLYASGHIEVDGNLGLATLLPQLIYDQPDSHYKQGRILAECPIDLKSQEDLAVKLNSWLRILWKSSR